MKQLTPKQQAIVKAAEKMFQEFGIKRVSIEEICRTAQASKMTFYKYFKNKFDLVQFIWNRWYENGMVEFDAIDAADTPFTEKIQQILALKQKRSSELSPDLIRDYWDAYPEFQQLYNQLLERVSERFYQFIRDAQQRGEVRASMKPEFFIAAIKKLGELVQDKALLDLYDNPIEFIMEFNNFLFLGVLPREEKP